MLLAYFWVTRGNTAFEPWRTLPRGVHRIAPFFRYPLDHADRIWDLSANDFFPFVETVARNQAAPFLKGLTI
jgi:hypothetical protein